MVGLASFLMLSFFTEGVFAQDLFKVSIPLSIGRQARVTFPDGSEKQVGRIERLPSASRWPGFDAAKWGKPGTVVATGVNAIHILLSIEKGRGRTISILPTYTVAPASGNDASIQIDGCAGTGLWAEWAPSVGTEVRVVLPNGEKERISPQNFPKAVSIEYTIASRSDCPYYVDIENRIGGKVTAVFRDSSRTIATVVHPVTGTGPFQGSQYQDTGRVRANHPGVVCISTVPYKKLGGFQIIPAEHAASPEMKAAEYEPEWMILAALPGSGPLCGKEPLFSGFLLPGPGPRDKDDPVWGKILYIPIVQCRVNNGPFQPLPVIFPGEAGNQLMRKITHLRILFPFELAR